MNKATLTCNVCGEDVSETKLTHECHVCCDGECAHDDCCGKIPDNCPNLGKPVTVKVTGNTFGEYDFDSWVPEEIRNQIRDFWGQMDRTHEDWIKNSCGDVSEVCYYIPQRGFKEPMFGSKVIFLVKDFDAKHRAGRSEDIYRAVEGRYIHAWNNMGRIVHDDGTYTVVSSCDMWVRVFKDSEEVESTLA